MSKDLELGLRTLLGVKVVKKLNWVKLETFRENVDYSYWPNLEKMRREFKRVKKEQWEKIQVKYGKFKKIILPPFLQELLLPYDNLGEIDYWEFGILSEIGFCCVIQKDQGQIFEVWLLREWSWA